MSGHPCTGRRQEERRRRRTKMYDSLGVHPGRSENCDKSSDRSTRGEAVVGNPNII